MTEKEETNKTKIEKERENDLIIVTVLGLLFAFLALLMIFICFMTGKTKPRFSSLVIGFLAYMLLSEVRRESGSPLKIIKKVLIDDAPELTFESAQKEMKNFVRERDGN